MDLNTLAPLAGLLPAARLELSEASGPVAPRYQYELLLRIVAGPEGVTLLHEGREGRPPMHLRGEGAIERGAYREIWRGVLEAGLLEPPATPDRAPEPRIGVSMNSIELQVGAELPVRHEYRLSLLRSEAAEDQPLRRLIETLKGLRSTVGARSPVTPP